MSRRVMQQALYALQNRNLSDDETAESMAITELMAALRHPDNMEGPRQSPPPMRYVDWLDLGIIHGWVKITAHTEDDFK